jgi:23S rRNA (cytosine1962-C5)-methyltransferase
MLIADSWSDYELIDMHMGEKLERWGKIIAVRPDPQVIWPSGKKSPLWENCHLRYKRSKTGGGSWEVKKKIPESWEIGWKGLKFIIHPTDFKHMGLFPEQAVNWERLSGLISSSRRPVKILNLFGYTGGATVACANAGAHVTHVDAAKGMIQWAKDNAALAKVPGDRLRFIADDAMKFVSRQGRKGTQYDAIIMDPPSYGRGSSGEVWKIEDKLYSLVNECMGVLTNRPLFFLINSYTTGFSPICAGNMLNLLAVPKFGGKVSTGEIGIPSANGLVLPCGIFALWTAK